MDTKFTIVVNPAAGGGKSPQRLQAVRTILAAAGAQYLVQESTSLEDAVVVASRAAARGDYLVAVGGDGMAGAIAGAVARAKPGGSGVLGIIPAGRGNDLARTYGVPFGSTDATKVLLAGELHRIDLIEVTGADGQQVIVAGGLYVGIASVAGQIANHMRVVRGPLVYPVAALRALANWKSATFTIEKKSIAPSSESAMTSEEFSGYGMVVMNVPYFGAGMKVAPDAVPNDGLLEVVLMRHSSKMVFLRVLASIRTGRHIELPQVGTFRATELRVTCDRSIPVGVDGESLHIRFPIFVRVLSNALSVIVPKTRS